MEEVYNVIYQNPMQRSVLNWSSNITGVRAGRGVGKTSLLAGHTLHCVQSIPRGTDVMLGSSVKQLYGRTMPSMTKEIEQDWHWIEGVHFFRGHAPKAAGFPEPLTKPRSWANCIHWYTGAVTYLASMAVKGSTNGMNISSLRCDETRYIPWDKIAEEVRPAVRGGIYDHPGWNRDKNPYYCSEWYVSDAAITASQAIWETVISNEALMDNIPEINDQISTMLAHLRVASMEGWSDELLATPEFLKRLNYLRSKSTNFFNFSTAENLEVLGGEDYLKKLRRKLPALIFNIQIMGAEKGVSKQDAYYANFDIDVHGYYPSQTSEEDLIQGKFNTRYSFRNQYGTKLEWESPDLEEIARSTKDCSLDVDCLPKEPLYITLDANSNINTFCIAQRYKMDGLDSCVILKSMYVLNERRLRSLCDDFHKYYAPHQRTCNEIIVYHDSTTKHGGAYALEDAEKTRFHNVIKEELEKRGWKVTLINMGNPMGHEQKFQFITDVLTGSKPIFLRVNRVNNDYLLASLANTKVKYINTQTGYGFYKKDKSLEKTKSKLEEQDATTITDMSDAFDNMLIGMVLFGRKRQAKWGSSRVFVHRPTIY